MPPSPAGCQRPERSSWTEQIVRRTGSPRLPFSVLITAMLLSGPAWGDDRADGIPAKRCRPECGGRILTHTLFAPGGPDALAVEAPASKWPVIDQNGDGQLDLQMADFR